MDRQKYTSPEQRKDFGIRERGGSVRGISLARHSGNVAVAVTLFMRVASRTSFVILGFYLGQRFASTTLIAFILEAYFISELLLAPLIGSLSDRYGRKPFMLLSPIVASIAAIFLMAAALLFPRPGPISGSVSTFTLLLCIFLGRLLEGAATACNVPTTLGYITDVTANDVQLRGQVMTAFQIATIGGLGLAIPFGGKVSSLLGPYGFLVVLGLYLCAFLLTARGIDERVPHQRAEVGHGSLLESFVVIRYKPIATFLPAWFSINALVGSWTTLATIILAYPDPAADQRQPGQLLYGGFSQVSATLLVGLFALIFLIGMGIWTPYLARLRRSSIMLISLGGLALIVIILTIINGLGENPATLSQSTRIVIGGLSVLLVSGVVLLSGFTPVALTQMSAIAESLPGKRGAVLGLYSVALAVGQLLGVVLGGIFVDIRGFYGLMIFSAIMGVIAFASVIYMRNHGHDVMIAVAESA